MCVWNSTSLNSKCYLAAADLDTWRRPGFGPSFMGVHPISAEGNLCAKEVLGPELGVVMAASPTAMCGCQGAGSKELLLLGES